MTFSSENVLLVGSLLLLISIITSKTSFRLGIPTLILFLMVGMLAGSDGPGGIHFDSPELAQFLGVVALNFILFSGGLDTEWEHTKHLLGPGILLSSLGVLLTAVSVGLFVTMLTNFTFLEGLLLGAIVSSTDAAAVFSVLRTRNITLKGNLGALLELESGSNDPMAYFLTISLTGLIKHGEGSLLSIIPGFFLQMSIGALSGIVMGHIILRIINKIHLEVEGLYPVLVMALIFFTFSATDFIGGNGFLAVYISALMLGRKKFIHKRSLIKFYDGQAWLMQIIMFITMGLLVYPSQIVPIMGIGVMIALFLMLFARPLAVFICLSFFNISLQKKIFISWVGLRGAIPIIFATYPLIAGLEKAHMIFNLVFFISVSSVLLQGSTLAVVAKWLALISANKGREHSFGKSGPRQNIKTELLETELTEGSPLIGKSIVQLNFPKKALIVLIRRNENYITPSGSTVLEAGDKLSVIADDREILEQTARTINEITMNEINT